MERNDYYSDHSRVSNSTLRDFIRSPYHYWFFYRSGLYSPPQREAESNEKVMGRFFHALILEPERVDEKFAVLPENLDRRTKKGKADYDAIRSESEGKTLIRFELAEAMRSAAEALRKNATIGGFLDSLEHREYRIDFDWNGVACRSMLDALSADPKIGIADIKTCLDASPRGFSRAAANRSYQNQAAFYFRAYEAHFGYPAERFVFIAIEKHEPYASNLFYFTPASKEIVEATKFIENKLRQFRMCCGADSWPSYFQEAEPFSPLELPSWASPAHIDSIEENELEF